jgi:MFS family permease
MIRFLGPLYAYRFFAELVVIYPLYAVMFLDHGLTPTELSLCLLAWSATAFVLEVPSGVLADHLPRKHILWVSEGLKGLGFACWLAFPTFWGFLAGFVLWGIKSACHSGCFEALVYDELVARDHKAAYAKVLGRCRALAAAAIMAASVGAGALAGYGYPLLLGVSLAAVAVAMLCALLLPAAPPLKSTGETDYLAHLRQGLTEVAASRRILWLIAFLAALHAAGGALEEYWPIFGRETGMSGSQIGYALAVFYAVHAAAAAGAHRLHRWPTSGLLAMLPAMGLLLAAAAAAFQPWAFGLLVAFNALYVAQAVVFESHLQEAIATRTRATVTSINGLAVQVACIGVYVCMGPLAQGLGWRGGFLAAAGAILAAGLALAATRRLARQAAANPA